MSTWRSGPPENAKNKLIVGSGKVVKRGPASALLNGEYPYVPADEIHLTATESPGWGPVSTRVPAPSNPPASATRSDLYRSEYETNGTRPVAPPPPAEPLFSKPVSLSYKVKEQTRGIIHPEIDKHFYIDPKHATLLEVVNAMSVDDPQNVMLVGPQGCGKTELAVWFAAKYSRPLIIMNCATIREAKDWFGFRDAKAGTLSWHKSEFVRALELGNAVVLMDEFNRLPTTLHNTLYPLLDARRATFVEDLEECVKVGPGTVFFATANIGVQHTGTFTMDSSMEDRWGTRIDVGFLKEIQETDIIVNKTGLPRVWAAKLASLATKIRAKANDNMDATLTRVISTRNLLHCAAMMRCYLIKKLEPSGVFEYCIVPFFSKDGGTSSEQAQVLQIVQGIFGSRR